MKIKTKLAVLLIAAASTASFSTTAKMSPCQSSSDMFWYWAGVFDQVIGTENLGAINYAQGRMKHYYNEYKECMGA